MKISSYQELQHGRNLSTEGHLVQIFLPSSHNLPACSLPAQLFIKGGQLKGLQGRGGERRETGLAVDGGHSHLKFQLILGIVEYETMFLNLPTF